MGHHQFDITSKSKSPETETDIADQVKGMDLNGLRRVTQVYRSSRYRSHFFDLI